MTGIHRTGGGGGCHGGGGGCHNVGGKGPGKPLGGAKPPTGSGKQKALGEGRPPTSKKFNAYGGPPGHGGIPPGQAKKFPDQYVGQANSFPSYYGANNANNGYNGGLLGGLLGSNGLLGGLLGGNTFSSQAHNVGPNGKPVPTAPIDPSINTGVGKGMDLQRVDQYNPIGKDANYVNGDANCGPALLASIAKAKGQDGGLTDAQLVNKLGAIAGTTGEGTSGNGMIDALQSMGLQTDAVQGSNLAWMNQALGEGKTLLLNGDFYSVAGRENPALQAGHYIAVTGVQNGQYSVVDPASGGVTSMSAAELQKFITAHPQGGFAIATW